MFIIGVTDLFGTKGVEYLLVIGFLLALTAFWRLVLSGEARVPAATGARSVGWFTLRPELHYHPGHTWVRADDGPVMRVGIDDFAQKLLGRPDAIRLPAVGQRITQGDPGLGMAFGDKSIDLVSPVGGTVVARNEAALESTDEVNRDPYGGGWLLEVDVGDRRQASHNLRNLLRGEAAAGWMAATDQALRQRLATTVGPVLQDGGVPVSGIARALSPEQWDAIAAEFLLREASDPGGGAERG